MKIRVRVTFEKNYLVADDRDPKIEAETIGRMWASWVNEPTTKGELVSCSESAQT